MPASTAKGYPYPVGSDPVRDGENAIQNLATTVDTKLPHATAVGTVTIPVSAATVGTAVVTLPVGRFPVAPRVVSSVRSTSVWFAYTSAVSASSLTLGVRSTSTAVTANIPVDYIAVTMLHNNADG